MNIKQLRRFNLDSVKPTPIFDNNGQFVLYDDIVRMLVTAAITNPLTKRIYNAIPRDYYKLPQVIREELNLEKNYQLSKRFQPINIALKPYNLHVYSLQDVGIRIIELSEPTVKPSAIRKNDKEILRKLYETGTCTYTRYHLTLANRLAELQLLVKTGIATFELTDAGRRVHEKGSHYV